MQTTNGSESIRDLAQRLLAAYEDLDRRFGQAGGLGALLELYDRVRGELDRVENDELTQMTAGIKSLVEALLRMDFELRTIQELKRVLAAARAAVAPVAG